MPGSLKELVKALSSALSSSPPDILPEELQETIELYLDKHENIELHDSQRLQDELLDLYRSSVSQDPSKQPAFLACLRLLRPAIHIADQLIAWWDLVIRPSFTSVGQEKAVVEDARELLLSVLIYDADEDEDGEKARASGLLRDKLLDFYLEKTKIPNFVDDETFIPGHEQDRLIASNLESILVAFGRRKPKDFLTAVDKLVVDKEHRAQALSLLCTFVRYQPPHLHQVLETPLIEHLLKCLMVDTSTTVISLALTTLVMFLPHIPNSLVAYLPRLFIVYSRILCWDRQGQSQTNLEPPTEAIESHSPLSNDDERPEASFFDHESTSDPSWEKLDHSFETAESTVPELTHYFTFLYGLYPFNFMSYIRKPKKYLKSAGFTNVDKFNIDQAGVRSRTERFRQVHLLHPNFFTMTMETELTDNRWLKSDPADVVTECMGLFSAIPLSLGDPGPPPSSKLPDIPEAQVRTEDIPVQSLLSMDEDTATLVNDPSSPTGSRGGASWRDTQSTFVTSHSFDRGEPLNTLRRPSQHNHLYPVSRSNGSHSRTTSPNFGGGENAADSPTLPPHAMHPDPEAKLQDMLQTQESLSNGVGQSMSIRNGSVSSLQSQDVASPRLGAYIQSLAQNPTPRSPAVKPATTSGQGHSTFLQREVMLLRNDLNFERYLRQQHLSHIGRLQRRHIKEATVEAETQKLVNTNRALRLKMEESKKSFALLKKESTNSKNLSKKWEGELNTKVRSLRDNQKHWKSDEDAVRGELRNARVECEHLRKLVVESEAKELLSRQRLESVEASLDELESIKLEVDSLNAKLREYESREDDYEQAREDADYAHMELETVQLKLRSQDSEREKAKKAYERRIAELEMKLQGSGGVSVGNGQTTPIPGQNSPAFQHMLDSALAASRTRFAQLKKAHTLLLNRYTELEMRYTELQSGLAESDDGTGLYSPTRGHHYSDDFSYDQSHGSYQPHSNNSRRQKTFSDSSAYTDDYPDYPDPNPPMSNSFPNRPTRLESLPHRQYPMSSETSPVAERSTLYRPQGPSQAQSQREREQGPTESSSNSLHSAESIGTRSAKEKEREKAKIKAQSEVRVFGRGGVQNIGKKDKKDKDKDKEKKGLKGLARGLV
ncbi:MAG: hypothetical protein M1819_005955 [Sarea resinae]|nr:MAG: hypothetical protein M1819_005955 [Sarea resinae]